MLFRSRLALAANAPLIPIAQWGDQEILGPYSKRLRLFPPKLVNLKCGDPLDLSKWSGKVDDPAAMEEATSYAVLLFADMVGELRNEAAPKVLFDIRKSDLPRTGNFRKKRKD